MLCPNMGWSSIKVSRPWLTEGKVRRPAHLVRSYARQALDEVGNCPSRVNEGGRTGQGPGRRRNLTAPTWIIFSRSASRPVVSRSRATKGSFQRRHWYRGYCGAWSQGHYGRLIRGEPVSSRLARHGGESRNSRASFARNDGQARRPPFAPSAFLCGYHPTCTER